VNPLRFLVGALLVGLGLVLVFWDKRAGRKRHGGFAHWEEVEGRVVSATVVDAGEAEAPSGRRDGLWTTEVVYAYRAGGAERQGRQRRFGGIHAGSLDRAERIAAAFPAGAAVEVAVDPDDPDVSALPYAPPNRALVGAGLVVGVLGLLILMAG
jgi:hypothetical protein